MDNNHDPKRYKRVRRACHSKIVKIGEGDDFRAEVQSRHINWEAKQKSCISTLPVDIDNLLRNIAYHDQLTYDQAKKKFFNEHVKRSVKKLEKEYSQRPNNHDWRSYRRALQKGELSEEEKRMDHIFREMFDEEYGRNKPTASSG